MITKKIIKKHLKLSFKSAIGSIKTGTELVQATSKQLKGMIATIPSPMKPVILSKLATYKLYKRALKNSKK